MPDTEQAAALNVPTEIAEVPELDGIIGLHLALSHAAVYRHFMETFTVLGLTQKQVAVLWLIETYPGISQTDIAKLLRMDRATMMAIVNRLQARKYLVRGRSATDKRRQTLVLGPDGRVALENAKVVIREHENWLKSRFTAREQTMLLEMLRRIQD